MERPERDQLSTAKHESGHAMIYLLHGVPIKAWTIRENETAYGSVHPSKRLSLPLHVELTNNLAGMAAQGRKFVCKDPLDLPSPFERIIFGSDTGKAILCMEQRLKELHIDPSIVHTNFELLHVAITSVYRSVRRLLKKDPFPQTVDSLAQYMMSRMEESGRGINARMQEHLHCDGIRREQQKYMKNLLEKAQYDRLLLKAVDRSRKNTYLTSSPSPCGS